jgi:hypothetical protein
MLKPDERAHLLELLRPPAGYELHTAVGTTYSLDLISALTVPLSFALFDWEDDEGRPTGDPLALLEALRRHGERFTLFCQAGQIRLPGKYPPLVAFLESSIFEARSPDPEGAFHPKVWVLRFVGEEGEIAYRVLCLSRNLTFDRSWDTVVSLDGTLSDRRTTIRKNLPLAEFVAALPTLAVGAIPDSRRKDIQLIAAELKRVRFTWPSGFEDAECRFWPGIPDLPSPDFGERRDASLIVSPFVSESVIRSFLEAGGPVHLVSRAETLDELPRELLRDCASIHTLQSQLNEECSEADNTSGLMDVLDGLHAKVFVVDHGRSASVFTGSFNATRHALDHNVEFMVEMVGKKSRHGVGSWLRNENGETRFADLLQSYSTEAAGEAGGPSPTQDPRSR